MPSNIAAIVRLEEDDERARSTTQHAIDAIARFSGTVPFVIIHVVWFVAWIVINAARPFDPYPFSFLTLVVSLEAIFLSTFVLISQSHAARLADRRAELDLQVNLLAEAELTKALKMLAKIAAKLGLDAEDPEFAELVKKTDVRELAEELTKQLPKA